MNHPIRSRTTILDATEAHRVISEFNAPLADYLRDTSRAELEKADSEVIDKWKASSLPGSVAPTDLGGEGAGLEEMVSLQMALGYFSPSLAAATTMHHLSMLSLVDFGRSTDSEEDRETVRALIGSHAVIASAFSESVPGGSVFRPSMRGERTEDGSVVLKGTKAPCSLSHSMDLLMASYLNAEGGRGVALVPADSEGVGVRDIWKAPVLKGSQSEMVRFDDVAVPADLTFDNDDFDPDGSLEKAAYQIFGLLICSTYLGAAQRALAELDDGSPVDNALLVDAEALVVAHVFALHHAAQRHSDARPDDAEIVDLLLVRTSLASALARIATIVSTLRGGRRFSSNPDLNYFVDVLHAYEYHPPSRPETVDAVMSHATRGTFSYVDNEGQ